MSGVPQSRTDLVQHLREHVRFVETSARLFDEGQTAEAKRIASSVRTLVHDTAASKSLLGQLGLKQALRFQSIANMFKPWNNIMCHGLVGIQFEPDAAAFVPHLDKVDPILMDFECWWMQPLIRDRYRQQVFTRKDLILSVANKDGGAHIDPELDAIYALLTRQKDFGFTLGRGGKNLPWRNDPLLPSVRQIGHEILRTLADVPELSETA